MSNTVSKNYINKNYIKTGPHFCPVCLTVLIQVEQISLNSIAPPSSIPIWIFWKKMILFFLWIDAFLWITYNILRHFFERSLWTRAMDAEKIEKLGTKKIWTVDGELYLWEFAKCSDSYSPKSGTTIVEFERRWSTCISTVRYTRHKNWFF